MWKGSESVAVDARGAAGGLGILWNPREVHLSGFIATPCTLTADFHIIGTRIRGVISNVYGPPRAEQKPTFLESISDLKSLFKDKAWIIGGDFNLIRNPNKKKEVFRT